MRNYAVIGDPVGHSRSPGMQNAAFEHYRLGSPYVKRHVRPGELGAFVEEARRTLAGFNCTVPHKSAIIPYLDEVDPKALAASSVNTVTVREDGTLAGTSTDGYGLEMALETNFGRPLAGAEVCFIGCGGAAHATSFHLAERGVRTIRLANRTLSKAEELAEKLRAANPGLAVETALPSDSDTLARWFAATDFLIQATQPRAARNRPRAVRPRPAAARAAHGRSSTRSISTPRCSSKPGRRGCRRRAGRRCCSTRGRNHLKSGPGSRLPSMRCAPAWRGIHHAESAAADRRLQLLLVDARRIFGRLRRLVLRVFELSLRKLPRQLPECSHLAHALGESIVTAPSHCPKCGTPIRWFDNIPVVSYLALRGRCRSCKAPISPRYVIVEALTGILFALLLFKVGATQQPPFTLLLYFTMTLLCITTIWIDFEHRLIPDATTYPAILFGLAASAAFPSAWGVSNHLLSGAYALISGAAAGGALALFAIVGRAVSGREVLGWGDVKFVTAAGILLGLPGACFAVLAGRCSDRSTAYSARSAAAGNSPASRFRSGRSSPSAASHGCSRAKSSCAGISVSFRILNRNCGAEGLHSSARVLYYPEQRPAMLRNR